MDKSPRPPRRRPLRDAPIVRRNTVRLPVDVARHIRAGHPWVFREALGPRPRVVVPGTVIDLIDVDGELVGKGLYDADSVIAVRVFTRRAQGVIDAAMVAERVRTAVALRRRIFGELMETTRLINAEGDGLSGIVVDKYQDYLVVQLYSSAVMPLRDGLYHALMDQLAPKGIYEQRRFRSLAGEAPRQAAAELVRGVPAPVELEVAEDDLKFIVDVTAPLSTGLFMDLREGRRAVRQWARGRSVLNLFSYTGAISVAAHAGGATSICAVDVAAKAHARARRNFAASGFDPEKPELIVGDALKVLARFVERKRTFDMVVIDPPAFASAAARGGKPWSATRDYSELVGACIEVLAPQGLLVAASSTHKLNALEYEQALAEGALLAQTQLRIIDRRGLPADFPTVPGFPEGNYLKFVIAARS
ncbi:MAG TPA: class I SAM-dependent rRNA methyltransferase [Kofleriaceae bacterium]|nr:class I SAM-dependent rRNA methyltransferase [Kofleriaceae bacterium]